MLTSAKTFSQNFIKFGLKTAEIWLIALSEEGKNILLPLYSTDYGSDLNNLRLGKNFGKFLYLKNKPNKSDNLSHFFRKIRFL